jgi:magnesium-transporting ATPase (P-type)
LVVFVYLSTAFLLIQYFRLDLALPTDVLNEVISLVFGIAPASLFFMIIVTYATGTADLGRLGALVYRAQSVESLAQATVICFAKAGILTGTYVEIETAKPSEEVEGEEPGLAESRLRQVLGDYARTTSVDNLAIRGMADTFEGSRRAAAEEAPFLAVYGWSAVAFDDEDLRGVYVLAEPEVLEAHLAFQAEGEESDEDRGALDAVRTAVAPVGRLFGRVRGLLPGAGEEDEQPPTEQPGEDHHEQPAVSVVPDSATGAAEGGPAVDGQGTAGREAFSGNTHSDERVPQDGDQPMAGLFGRVGQRIGHALRLEDTTTEDSRDVAGEGKPSQEAEAQPGLFRRLALQVNRVLRQGEIPAEDQESPTEELPVHETVLAFAYQPDLEPLHDAAGQPHLPRGLIPLCTLRYTQRVRPEAVDTIKTFSRTGVGIKVFAAGPPEQTATMLRQAGLGGDEDGAGRDLGTISGGELAKLEADQFVTAAQENTVFGDVSPEQAGDVVAALRESGEIVAVVGDAVADLPPLRQANLAISRQTSTQAALSVSDIVLLEDSPAVLSVVLQKGQRIVNGLLDVLKVNLTQVLYLAFLIVGVRLAAYGYPYRSGQGTVIAVATVALPSLGLSLGAAAGVLPSARLGRLLARFVLPAAMTIGATALVVYLFFLDRTGDVSYAQLAVMYTLVGCGLLLVVFIKPPRQRWYTGRAQAVAWWPVLLAAILFPTVILVSAIPLAQNLLHVGLLKEPEHYAVVGLAVLAWALVLRFVLWIVSVPSRR